jgi:hypothetical protein
VRGRVVAVDPTAEDRDRPAARFERPSVGLAVDPAGHATDDDESGGRELTRQRARDRPAIRRARAARPTTATAGSRSIASAPDPRTYSRVGGSWIAVRSAGKRGITSSGSTRMQSRRQLPRKAIGERLGDVRGLDVGRTRQHSDSAEPLARPALGRDPRAGAGRPRSDRSSVAASVRRGTDARSARARRAPENARPPTLRQAMPPAPPPAAGGIATARSNRSRSAATASRDRRRGAVRCNHIRPRGRPARRMGTCSSSSAAPSAGSFSAWLCESDRLRSAEIRPDG